jgi:integrase
MNLTRQTVAGLKLPAGKSEAIYFDDALTGFGVRLRDGGRRTWIVQYRLGQKQRRVSLGRVEAVPVDKARKTARDMLAKVTLGDDPAGEREEKKARAAITFDVVRERYLEHTKERCRPSTFEAIERCLKKQCATLNRLQVHGIKRADIAALLVTIGRQNGGVSANRARSYLGTFFAWAMREGLVEENPTIGTNRAAVEKSRDRVLSDAELAAIWKACRDDAFGHIVKLLMLTGQRRDEVGSMMVAELDLAGATWSLPGERTKNGRAHIVPLSAEALEVLRPAVDAAGDRQLVFGGGDAGFAGWSKAKAALDQRMIEAISPKARAAAQPWTLHDLRRTFATRSGDLGVLPHVVEAVLNHVSGHRAGVAGVYNRALYLPEKRQALYIWGAHVEAIAKGTASKVTPLRVAS